MRIHITGNAGAGKTTLAQRIAQDWNLPLVHLDQIVWRPGWRKPPTAERDAQIESVVAADEWVIDGVSPKVRAAADFTVFLDVPRRVCAWRCAKRNAPYLFRSRPELPEDCPEILIIPRLARIIWRFPSLIRPGLLDEAVESDRMLVTASASDGLAAVESFLDATKRQSRHRT